MQASEYINQTDQQLLAGIALGDHAALEMLFVRYYQPLCHYLLLYVPDNGVAQELCADYFVWLWERRDGLNIQDFKGYSYMAVKNSALDYKKKKTLPIVLLESLEPEAFGRIDQQDALQQLEDREFYDQAMLLIEQLPQRQREVFRLSRFSMLTSAQIAVRLGISVRTVENTLYQSLQRLKKSFQALR